MQIGAIVLGHDGILQMIMQKEENKVDEQK